MATLNELLAVMGVNEDCPTHLFQDAICRLMEILDIQEDTKTTLKECYQKGMNAKGVRPEESDSLAWLEDNGYLVHAYYPAMDRYACTKKGKQAVDILSLDISEENKKLIEQIYVAFRELKNIELQRALSQNASYQPYQRG